MRGTCSPYIAIALFISALAVPAGAAASKTHILSFGKWRPAQVIAGPEESGTTQIKIRGLYLDGKLKEFTAGEPHEITDRLFTIRRVFRLNDSLPSEGNATPRWVWRVGEWLLVNRVSGKVTSLALPAFDSFYSDVSWYQDYAAYCGLSESRGTLIAMVVQVGTKKPLLKRELGPAHLSNGSECSAPAWERQPTRVTFQPRRYPKVTYSVFGTSVDLASENAE